MDPMDLLDELFEEEFQKFMHGAYSRTLEEDWEREAAQQRKTPPRQCPHGLTRLTCSKCYFHGDQ